MLKSPHKTQSTLFPATVSLIVQVQPEPKLYFTRGRWKVDEIGINTKAGPVLTIQLILDSLERDGYLAKMTKAAGSAMLSENPKQNVAFPITMKSKRELKAYLLKELESIKQFCASTPPPQLKCQAGPAPA